MITLTYFKSGMMGEQFISSFQNPVSKIQIRNGGGERARTDGLLRARQALSQLSYTPYSA
jgi:hypothetical protein